MPVARHQILSKVGDLFVLDCFVEFDRLISELFTMLGAVYLSKV